MTSNGPASANPSGAITLTPRAPTCSRQRSLRTVAVTRAPAIVPSCTAAVPTPPARAVDEQPLAGRQPGLGEERVVGGGEDLRHPAGRDPVEVLGHRHRGPLVDHGELGLPAAADDRHDPVARLEALGAGPSATTSPASSRPGMSGGQPGGAG